MWALSDDLTQRPHVWASSVCHVIFLEVRHSRSFRLVTLCNVGIFHSSQRVNQEALSLHLVSLTHMWRPHLRAFSQYYQAGCLIAEVKQPFSHSCDDFELNSHWHTAFTLTFNLRLDSSQLLQFLGTGIVLAGSLSQLTGTLSTYCT